MLEKVKEIELFKDYHFDEIIVEDGRVLVTASTSQRERIADEFTGDGIDDKFRDILDESTNFLTGAFEDIMDGIEQADSDHPLDDPPSLEPEEPDEAVEVDVDEELDQIREEQGKPPAITFDESAARDVIGAHGWSVNADGYIINDGGQQVIAFHGKPIKLDEFAGIVNTEDGYVPIRDNFADLVEWVSDRR